MDFGRVWGIKGFKQEGVRMEGAQTSALVKSAKNSRKDIMTVAGKRRVDGMQIWGTMEIGIRGELNKRT